MQTDTSVIVARVLSDSSASPIFLAALTGASISLIGSVLTSFIAWRAVQAQIVKTNHSQWAESLRKDVATAAALALAVVTDRTLRFSDRTISRKIDRCNLHIMRAEILLDRNDETQERVYSQLKRVEATVENAIGKEVTSDMVSATEHEIQKLNDLVRRAIRREGA